MTRAPFLAANWKMFKTVHEAVVYTKEFRILVKDLTGVELVVAPPFTAVHAVAEAARNSAISVAGQDVYWEREGAFTGEISATMLMEAGAEYRNRRPLRAPAAVRRDGSDRQPQDAGGLPGGPLSHRLRRGDARRARERPHPRRPGHANQGGPRRTVRRAGGGAGHRLRARLGDRDGPECDRGAGWRRPRAHPRAAEAVVWGGSLGALSHHLWRQREARQHRRARRARRTSTGRWWVAPASTSARLRPLRTTSGQAGEFVCILNRYALLRDRHPLRDRLPSPAAGRAAPAGPRGRHRERVRRRWQQSDGVRRTAGRDGALEGDHGARGAVHARRAAAGHHRAAAQLPAEGSPCAGSSCDTSPEPGAPPSSSSPSSTPPATTPPAPSPGAAAPATPVEGAPKPPTSPR